MGISKSTKAYKREGVQKSINENLSSLPSVVFISVFFVCSASLKNVGADNYNNGGGLKSQ